MDRPIRIGTRCSPLAIWQADFVRQKLSAITTVPVDIVKIHSEGDLSQTVPIYQLGVVGVFTRSLDQALLERRIDVAVHSLKDVPTVSPLGILPYAILERGNPNDVLVFNRPLDFDQPLRIGTSSLRRRYQWLHRYPSHMVMDVRGSVQTRLEKMHVGEVDALIMAHAGLNRLGLLSENSFILDWMVPAPAQGAIAVYGREEGSTFVKSLFQQINHRETQFCTDIERSFLNHLEGGCSAPIGAHAVLINEEVTLSTAFYQISKQQEIRKSYKMSVDQIIDAIPGLVNKDF